MRSAEVSLERGPNLFVGRNGQGKTNLVESLGYLATLGSHRVSSDAALIRQGQDSAVVRARLESNDRELLAEVQINRSGANRAQINRGAIKVRELPRYFSSILFAPEDLALVRGEPGGRRRFVDELLVARNPRLSWRPRATTTGCCVSATHCSSRPGPRGCRPTSSRPSTSGTTGSSLSAARSSRRATSSSRRSDRGCADVVLGRRRRRPRGRARHGAAASAAPVRDDDDPVDEGAAQEPIAQRRHRASLPRDPRARPPARARAGCHARRPPPRRPLPLSQRAAGPRLREPRRILVVRPRAEARVGGSAARRLDDRRPRDRAGRRLRRARPDAAREAGRRGRPTTSRC